MEATQSTLEIETEVVQENRATPMEAIRKHCMECCCGLWSEVERCHSPHTCTLWPFRFGQRPETARKEGRLVDPALFVCTCSGGTTCTGRAPD